MASPPFKVKAVYDYASGHDEDLNFPVGQVISVTEEEGDDWYVGEYTDATGVKKDGLFPRNFVEKYEPEVPVRPTRPARPRQDVQSVSQPGPAPVGRDAPESDRALPVPAVLKLQAPPVEVPAAVSKEEELRSPTSATSPQASLTRSEPPQSSMEATSTTPARVAPPSVKPKPNAFKDRIAAFNRAEQPPIAPMQANRQNQAGGFIRKPFVAPPPSSTSYIPPIQKQEPLHRPYVREEDPEIKQRQEEDRAAAEAAGVTGDLHAGGGEGDDDEVKPLSLKERMALLQREQEERRLRHAAIPQKKDKRTTAKKASEVLPTEEDEDESPNGARGGDVLDRKSLDVPRDRPRVPSGQGRLPAEHPIHPLPAVPQSEILSGGEEADQSGAGDTTEDDAGTIGPDESDERHVPAVSRHAAPPAHEEDVGDEEDTVGDAGEEEETERDEEEERKKRIRERMEKLRAQGNVGFNPFGGQMPGPAPPSRKSTTDKQRTEGLESILPPQAPVPVMPLPGMQNLRNAGSDDKPSVPATEDLEDDDHDPPPPPRRSATNERGGPPAVPEDRPTPPAQGYDRSPAPPPPGDRPRPTTRPSASGARSVPAASPYAAPLSPGPGSESDDEMSARNKRSSTETSVPDTAFPTRTGTLPTPTTREVPSRPNVSPENKRASTFSVESPSLASEKRLSRAPPPIPGSPVASSRPPPPPPPPNAAQANRQSTAFQAPEDHGHGESDYEGDYDTDIASSAKHKDALKAHAREPSLDDSTTADDTPATTPALPASTPRAVPPPPPPPQNSTRSRPSMDQSRAPPPVPFAQTMPSGPEEAYDPYRYVDMNRAAPSVTGAIPVSAPPIPPEPKDVQGESSADDLPLTQTRKSVDRPPPPPPVQQTAEDSAPALPFIPQQATGLAQPPPNQSLDNNRSITAARRSIDQGRAMGEEGQIAQDVDLSPGVAWWTAPQPLPPIFQRRNGIDLLSECEESTRPKRGGRSEVTKEVYVLFMDYSFTTITAVYDPQAPAQAHLDQKHEPPAPKLRQDQLEAYWQRFGAKIAEAANTAGNSKKDAVIGDGSPNSLPLELIKQLVGALHPVGTRAYGATVYYNMANASTRQYDEIRPGDIITVRNARFEGHHGTMRQKYKQDFGAWHVAVVEEWDGTKRSVRAWEQGREGKGGKGGGVRSEKFRLGDLRSGEVKVWRVVGRDWVGWETAQ